MGTHLSGLEDYLATCASAGETFRLGDYISKRPQEAARDISDKTFGIRVSTINRLLRGIPLPGETEPRPLSYKGFVLDGARPTHSGLSGFFEKSPNDRFKKFIRDHLKQREILEDDEIYCDEPLDLRGATIEVPIEIRNCRFTKRVYFDNANLRAITLNDSTFEDGFRARFAKFKGGVSCRRVTCKNGFNVESAEIDGALDLTGAELFAEVQNVSSKEVYRAPEISALFASGLTLKGNLRLQTYKLSVSRSGERRLRSDDDNRRFIAEGQVNLDDAEIGGSVICTGSCLHGPLDPDGNTLFDAFRMADCSLAGSLFINTRTSGPRFHSKGSINLSNAQIEGRINGYGALITNCREKALDLRSAVIGGSVILRSYGKQKSLETEINSLDDIVAFQIDGTVFLKNTKIGGDFDLRAALVCVDSARIGKDKGPTYSINATQSEIGGSILFDRLGQLGFQTDRSIQFKDVTTKSGLYLFGSQLGTVSGNGSKTRTVNLELDGLKAPRVEITGIAVDRTDTKEENGGPQIPTLISGSIFMRDATIEHDVKIAHLIAGDGRDSLNFSQSTVMGDVTISGGEVVGGTPLLDTCFPVLSGHVDLTNMYIAQGLTISRVWIRPDQETKCIDGSRMVVEKTVFLGSNEGSMPTLFGRKEHFVTGDKKPHSLTETMAEFRATTFGGNVQLREELVVAGRIDFNGSEVAGRFSMTGGELGQLTMIGASVKETVVLSQNVFVANGINLESIVVDKMIRVPRQPSHQPFFLVNAPKVKRLEIDLTDVETRVFSIPPSRYLARGRLSLQLSGFTYVSIRKMRLGLADGESSVTLDDALEVLRNYYIGWILYQIAFLPIVAARSLVKLLRAVFGRPLRFVSSRFPTIAGSIANLWRFPLGLVERALVPMRRIVPFIGHAGNLETQPYEQMAASLKRQGREKVPRELGIRKQKLIQTQSAKDGDLGRWLFLYLLGCLAGYGFRLTRAATQTLVIIALSTLVFWKAGPGQANIMHPMDSATMVNQMMQLDNGRTLETLHYPTSYPKYHPFFYVLDVFVPVLDLHQERYWAPESRGEDRIVFSTTLPDVEAALGDIEGLTLEEIKAAKADYLIEEAGQAIGEFIETVKDKDKTWDVTKHFVHLLRLWLPILGWAYTTILITGLAAIFRNIGSIDS